MAVVGEDVCVGEFKSFLLSSNCRLLHLLNAAFPCDGTTSNKTNPRQKYKQNKKKSIVITFSVYDMFMFSL